MQTVAILCLLALSCFASPVLQQQAASGSASIAYAVDVDWTVPSSAFECVRQSHYNVAFIQGYSGYSQGMVNQYAISNIKNANSEGLGTEVYMELQPKSSKTGAQQLDEMYGTLRNANINIRSVWVQVTDPMPNYWYSNTTLNINFLNSIFYRARQYGLSIGIYTSANEWSQITGNATISNAMLWYWSTTGGGTAYESPANFDDFRPFGGWTTPSVKQFGRVEMVCGVPANKNIYAVSGAEKFTGMVKYKKSEPIFVGSLGLGTVAAGRAEIKK
ncbi:hypothetical protein ANCCAN_13446 [Ancylostoma caninum]|uniref:Glycosyl hydrolase family 25 n=1 Tax=Ancylostoma caninum TaxID=29170 RepID=A0A368GCV7_ANCCA|nr:hypothetical protein ANCCAN_13446 [Ancylostoma caninum]